MKKSQSHVYGRSFIACILLLVLSFQIFNAEAQIRSGKISDFRQPAEDWQAVGSVRTDPSNPLKLETEEGTGIFYNGREGKTAHLLTIREFGDIELHLEFIVPENSNSGIYLQGRYEIQIRDSWLDPALTYNSCGGVYHRWDHTKAKGSEGYEGTPPLVKADKEPGQWQSLDLIFRAPLFDQNGVKVKDAEFEQVVLNGNIVHRDVVVTGPTRSSFYSDEKATGPLMIQGDHGPVAIRNILIRELSYDDEKPVKTGKWQALFTHKEGPGYDFIFNVPASNSGDEEIFRFEGKKLMVMQGWKGGETPVGMIVTKEKFSEYDLKLEFKWGERRFPPREEKKRDAGLLLHVANGTEIWPTNLEYQIQEGDCGDLWAVRGASCNKLEGSNHRAVKWSDNEKSGWNKVFVEVRGDNLKFYLNGQQVNEMINASFGGFPLTEGYIGLQAEAAELTYRNIKIKPYK